MASNRLPESNVYPKTNGKVRDLIWQINKHRSTTGIAGEPFPEQTTFPFVGTTKLHGTHADIVFQPGGGIRYQSRNCYLTSESDSHGFAEFCDCRRPALHRMREMIEEAWSERHAESTISKDHPIVMAGEWIGTGIQKGMAVSQLSKRFVLCGVKVNGIWEPIYEYGSIGDADVGIYNISVGGIYHLDISLEDEGAAYMKEAEKLTMQIVESCPFGKVFGVDGSGEGIVWTPASHTALPNASELWYKTKLETFRTPVIKAQPTKDPTAVERSARAKQFAEVICSEARMEQAWDYLRETGLEQSKKSMGSFLSWLWNDIEVEEKVEIQEADVGSDYKVEGARIAKTWFLAKL